MTKVGDFLREYREIKKISQEDVALSTNISIKYIKALEESDYKVFSALIYAKGYLRAYTQYLQLANYEIENIIKRYEKEYKEYMEGVKGKTNA